MATDAVKKNLLPDSLIDNAVQLPLVEFMTLHGDTQFLLVRVDDLAGELAATLAASQRTGDSLMAPRPNSIGYNTVASGDGENTTAVGDGTTFGQAELQRLLIRHPHFVVPLRKRSGDGTYIERISVGRARNKDVVLRDRSVSKFHAWFEMDEHGRFYTADAGSKNGTKVNGELLVPREMKQIHPGDRVRLGSVETILCPPDLLWTSLNPTG